jgi:8-oxo-dGTP pyrophosphatase MutT (NUDIX family)
MASVPWIAVKERLRMRPAPEPTPEQPSAAVATIVREGHDDVEILLIERAKRVGDPWSGHLAFPGGKRDRTDDSLLRTALRETEEEVGLRLPETALLARLADVAARVNGVRVAQFVFAVDNGDSPLAPNGEVTDVLWVPLTVLGASGAPATFTYTGGERAIEMPCVHLDGRVLWGMTYRMVQQLLAAL